MVDPLSADCIVKAAWIWNAVTYSLENPHVRLFDAVNNQGSFYNNVESGTVLEPFSVGDNTKQAIDRPLRRTLIYRAVRALSTHCVVSGYTGYATEPAYRQRYSR